MQPAINITGTFRGLAEVHRNFEKVMGEVRRRGTRRAMNAAATPVLREAKRRVPVDSGKLKKSLKKRQITDVATGKVAVTVGSSVPYTHLVEFGHNSSRGGPVKAKPFLRPAFDSREKEAQAIFERELVSMIEKELAKRVDRGDF